MNKRLHIDTFDLIMQPIIPDKNNSISYSSHSLIVKCIEAFDTMKVRLQEAWRGRNPS